MVGSEPEEEHAFFAGDGEYAIEVISEIRHQERIEWLAQGRGEEPAEHTCTALLVHEPDNPFDPSAVSVSIDGVRVGYLPPAIASDMVVAMRACGIDRATCDAIIEGGWYRSAEDKGDFRVRLDLDSDFAPESVPLPEAVPQSQPGMADARPRPRNVVHDLVLGAAATVAMFVALGAVWLYMQSQSGVDRRFAVASSTAQVAEASPPRQRDRPETTALARAAPGSAGTVAPQVTRAVAAPDSTARAIAAGTSGGVNNPRAVIAAAEAANNTAAPLPPEPESAVPPSDGGVVRGGAGLTQTETASRAAPPASTAADHAVIAAVPAVVPEIDPPPHPAAPVAAAPVVEELDPSAAAAVFQSALPPLPKPPPPQAVPDDDGPSAPAAVATREPPQARGASASRKHEARRRLHDAQTRRALERPRAMRTKSSYSAHNGRRHRRTLQYWQETPSTPAPASAPRAVRAPAPLAPFDTRATRMIEGLAKEWSTQALPALRPPASSQ